MNEDNVWNKLYKSPIFIGILLVYIPLTEWVIYEFIISYKCYNPLCCNPYFGFVITLLFILIFFISIGCILQYFSLSALTLFRFLNNEIGSRPLNLLFALVFAMHLSWICDSGYDLVFKDEELYLVYWSRLGLAIIGMTCVFLIFPKRKKIKYPIPPEKRKLLVMGLSEIKLNEDINNIETAVIPFSEYVNIKTVVVLLSENMNPVRAGKDDNKKIDLTLLNPETKLYEAYENYKNIIHNYKNAPIKKDAITALENLLIEKIKDSFPAVLSPDEIQFIFTEPVSYNDFDTCYTTIDSYLKKYEKNTEETVINISPGTALVTGVMSIHAIKGQRQLVYTKQSNNKKLEMIAYNPDVWTLGQLMQELTHELLTDKS